MFTADTNAARNRSSVQLLQIQLSRAPMAWKNENLHQHVASSCSTVTVGKASRQDSTLWFPSKRQNVLISWHPHQMKACETHKQMIVLKHKPYIDWPAADPRCTKGKSCLVLLHTDWCASYIMHFLSKGWFVWVNLCVITPSSRFQICLNQLWCTRVPRTCAAIFHHLGTF